MTPALKDILLNRDVIAIDQDPLGSGPYRVSNSNTSEIWAKRPQGGGYAIAFFNKDETKNTISVKWSDVDLTGALHVRDLWKHSDLGSIRDRFKADVPSHGTVLIRITETQPRTK